MARPNQEDVETFANITGLSEAIAVQKLEEHGDINEALYVHFNEGERNLAASSHQRPLSHLSPAGNHNPSSFLDPTVGRNIFDAPSDPTNLSRSVTQPREPRETPIDVRDGHQYAPQAGHAPIIGTVPQDEQRNTILSDISLGGSAVPIVLSYENLPDGSDDIEEQMIRAAIEASKKEYEESSESGLLEVPELAHAISLSIESAVQEEAQRLQGDVRAPIVGPPKLSEVEPVKIAASNGRLQAGSSFFQDEAEDAEEQPLIRNRSRPISLGSTDLAKNANVIETSTLSSSGNQDSSNSPQRKRNAIHEKEWGGISSMEHDEAVMLEAAMFGGIPEGSSYSFPNGFMHNKVSYLYLGGPAPRTHSPSRTAQPLIKEQQDDEYLASLQADREKESRAVEEAEAACEEERRREEGSHKKSQEEKELERQLAAKEAALPPEPSLDDENAVTLLVKMPDGSRSGRRFLRSDNLQSLFDFIDIGRVVKPVTYRLVRQHPRRAFSDGESALTLNEADLTSKQEALFLELI